MDPRPRPRGGLGRLRFVALYLLAGLGGNVAAYLFTAPNPATAGASTAVFGLMVAIFVIPSGST